MGKGDNEGETQRGDVQKRGSDVGWLEIVHLMDGWHEEGRQTWTPTDWLNLLLSLSHSSSQPCKPSPPSCCSVMTIFLQYYLSSMLKMSHSLPLNDPLTVTSKSECRHIMFFLVNVLISSGGKHMIVSVCPLRVSLLLCLTASFSPSSLRGNLLGIAPLLSSPPPGCCCRRRRLYSVTTVCTQPGAPSNATSLTYTPHGGPNGACVLNTHTSCWLWLYRHSCLCLCRHKAPGIHLKAECLFNQLKRKQKEKYQIQ